MDKQSHIYDFDLCTVDGKIIRMDAFKGKFILIVNIASECGFSEQLQELENCYQALKDQGLVVLAFPSDQFRQEPLDNEELHAYHTECRIVSFPIFQKIYVNGEHAHPLFKYLSLYCPGIFGTRSLKWNFTKFLVDANGKPIRRFSPITNMVLIQDYIAEVMRYDADE
ncbi:MAG: glutathione peroxidase [Pseudomonadota bacterium]|nr:glutathione peroxidase [Pseudomonadota bacterium]